MPKILTLNVNYTVAKHGPWPQRRDLIREVIESACPDVILLQAVRQEPGEDEGRDQAHQLAGLLPEYGEVWFQPAMTRHDGTVDGSAVLSRLPLVESDCLALSLRPGLEDTNRRALLHAQVNLPDGGGPVHLFNAHLSWVYAQAQDNLEEALPYINSVSGPALMLGDMNMLPDSDLWLPLREAGWVDTWQALRPDDDGYTYESDRPYMRIDYAWANRLLAGQPKAIEVLAKERDGVRMSDHLGLLVTL